MQTELKELMLEHSFCSEVEMYTSDMHFKMFDYSKENRFVRAAFGPTKHEDLIDNLVYKLNAIKDRYATFYNEIVNKALE